MRQDWHTGVHAPMTVHRVPPAELYDLMMTGDREVKPGEVFDRIVKGDWAKG